MEEEEEFVPNLASMLEVSLVEGADAVLSEEPTEIGGEAKSNIISVNGVATPAAESYTDTQVTDVKCNQAGEENEMHSGCQEVLPTGKEDEEAKQLFYSTFKDTSMVMYLRLHCTVCNCHIGCTPAAAFTMAFHKFLRVLICKDCETFYGNGDFTCGDDGSETFCRWCGQGGHLYCCSICPNVFCKKCIRGNLGRNAVKIIGANSNWVCYQCNLQPLLEHRALCWGLSTFLKEQSKNEKKIPEDEAEKSPGFNSKLCCQGEKLPSYRVNHPLRPIVYPTWQKLTFTDESTLTSQSDGILCNILCNTLTSDGNVRITTPSTVAETRAKPGSMTVHGAASSTQPVGVVTSQAASTGKHLMPVRTPALNNVSDAAVKLPAPNTRVKPNVSVRKSTLYVLQKQPQSTYESVFLSHPYKNGVQSRAVCQNQTPGQNSAVTVTSHVSGSTPANLKASTRLTRNQIPLKALMLSPVPKSIAGPTVNEVVYNQKNNSGRVIHTASPLHLGAVRRLQYNTVTPVPTTYNRVRSIGTSKLVPLSRFPNAAVAASGPVQFTCPPHPKNAVSESAIENKTASPSVSDGGGDDDYIVEVFSNVQNSKAREIECKWMMESFKRVNCTSRLFLYHLDILRQKFEKERSAKGTSHIVGKYYRLLKKVLERLNVQKDCVSKEFSFWLNAEKAKHGIPTTEAQNSSPSQIKGSDAEVTQEPELLLDMEVTCSSDHEDVSDPITEVEQNLNGCNENLSDSDSDSDDPFSDCESNEQEKVIPVLKPILSHTVREVLRDKCSRKVLLQLLRECDSKTANVKSKIISSAEAVQSIDGKEASSVKEKEHEMSKLKTHVSTGVQTEETSANCSEFSFCVPEPVPCSDLEKGKSVGTEAIDSNGKAVQGSQVAPSSSGIEGETGIESGRNESPCKSNVAKCVDGNSEVVRDSQMESSTSGAEGKTVNADCDKSNQKYQATKRKYHSVFCTVTTSHMETKTLCTRRSAAVVPSKLQRTAIPVTDFTTVVGSDVRKKVIKPCFVSVARLNKSN